MGMTLSQIDRDLQLVGAYHTVTARNAAEMTPGEFAALAKEPELTHGKRKIAIVE